jgi:GTPase SAR1 family protein
VCHEKSYKIICPQCHNELPHEIDRHKGIIISVIGAKNTGKSHFIAVLIDQMRKYVSSSFNASFSPINTDHEKRYKNDFYTPLYSSHRLLNSTVSGSTAQRPLIYALTISGNSFFKRNNTIIYITFFDTAGEDLSDEDTMSSVNKYIGQSSGIIFLLDPMQIQNVRDKTDPAIVTASSGTGIHDLADPADILRRVSDLIRDANNLGKSEKIPIPIAATFTKIDALGPLLHPGCIVLEDSPHRSLHAFNQIDSDNIHAEIESMLSDWGGWDFPQQLSVNYKKYGYFGLSALGKAPKGQNIDVIRPHRIEDPLLWLLSLHNIIPRNKK